MVNLQVQKSTKSSFPSVSVVKKSETLNIIQQQRARPAAPTSPFSQDIAAAAAYASEPAA